jgi:hypothetical protein
MVCFIRFCHFLSIEVITTTSLGPILISSPLHSPSIILEVGHFVKDMGQRGFWDNVAAEAEVIIEQLEFEYDLGKTDLGYEGCSEGVEKRAIFRRSKMAYEGTV